MSKVNSKKIFITVVCLFVVYVAWFTYQSVQEVSVSAVSLTNQDINITNQSAQRNIFDAVQLTTRKNFKLIGNEIFMGTGFKPGFNFIMTLAGSKFGTELISQNGATDYVGYLDLSSQSTTTKIFTGKMLDKNDKTVEAMLKIYSKTCIEPKGSTTSLSVSIKVATETLSGCAIMTK